MVLGVKTLSISLWKAQIQLQNAIGERILVKARKEVILSGVAYSSPAIMLRLGVNDRSCAH